MSDLLIRFRQIAEGRQDVLVMGLAVLFGAVVLGVVVVLLLRSRTAAGRLEALLEDRATRTGARTGRWWLRVALLVLVVAAVALADHQTWRPSECTRCHGKGYAKSLDASAHRALTCADCHSTGSLGPLGRLVSFGRWTIAYASVTSPTIEMDPGSVSSDACLRCHGAVRQGDVTSRGIRVRHADFLDAGATCRDCHNSSAHPGIVLDPSTPAMSKCVRCHDGKRAPSDCPTCHVGGDYTAGQTRDLPKVSIKPDCYGCHTAKVCNRCHGVTMPHPADWLPNPAGPGRSGSHARAAFADKSVCWRCHFDPGKTFAPSEKACEPCHGGRFVYGTMHGGQAWVAEHGPEATGKHTGIYAKCYDCHASGLCTMCHPASYEKLYAPKEGPDAYRRDVPWDPEYFKGY